MDDLIPATSPLLRPTNHRLHRNSQDSFTLTSTRNEDIPEDLEFLAPGTWADHDGDDDNDQDYDDSDPDTEDEESLEDFTLEDGHIEGVPSCGAVLHAKQYHTAEFHELLLGLLRDDLRVAGWAHLPSDLPASLIHIHKVSGALTNAVFFVSIPPASFEINSEGLATPMIDDRQLPATPSSLLGVNSKDEPAEQSPRARTLAPGQRITIEAPTLLVRVYGPSSGSLISRRTELHILHTLSTVYKIGPAVLGTFANGRVEEYFHSRALTKDEMRDPRFSRWIGRRMRELHRVEVEQMEPPIDERSRSARSPSVDSVRSRSGSEPPERPSLENVGTISHKGSSTSIYSTSSGSSIFSFGSAYSASTAGSFSSSRSARSGSLSSDLGAPVVNSPLMMPCRGPSESRANTKKRSRRSMRSVRGKRSRDKLGVWENITRWTREAKMVLKELDKLSDTPGYYELLKASKAALAARKSSSGDQHIVPLASLAQTVELRSNVNLPLFEQQIKSYRSLVRDWERSEGKSKRVFAHNDTQYGNLLLLTPAKPEDEKRLEQQLQAPHQKIIVVDFEYASANPRGFDIANHFIEWRADYHHETMSHSLSCHHPYPNSTERARFLRAYVGCDGGLDTSDPASNNNKAEDARVLRLEDEVRVWEPSSHAMWATWGIVQAKEDLLHQVAKWKEACERIVAKNSVSEEEVRRGVEGMDLDQQGRPKPHRGKSGETVNDATDEHGDDNDDDDRVDEGEAPVVDFDYLSYALERISLFRAEAGELATAMGARF